MGQLSSDGATASARQTGNLADGLFGLSEAVDLVSLFSAEVLVRRATSTCRLKRPRCQQILCHQLPGSSLLLPVLEYASLKTSV
jgi:hypothetical protein